jgi:hypothetical protein
MQAFFILVHPRSSVFIPVELIAGVRGACRPHAKAPEACID